MTPPVKAPAVPRPPAAAASDSTQPVDNAQQKPPVPASPGGVSAQQRPQAPASPGISAQRPAASPRPGIPAGPLVAGQKPGVAGAKAKSPEGSEGGLIGAALAGFNSGNFSEVFKGQNLARLASQASSVAGSGAENVLRGLALVGNLGMESTYWTYRKTAEGFLKGLTLQNDLREAAGKAIHEAARATARGFFDTGAEAAAKLSLPGAGEQLATMPLPFDQIKGALAAGMTAVTNQFGVVKSSLNGIAKSEVINQLASLVSPAKDAAAAPGTVPQINAFLTNLGAVTNKGAALFLQVTPFINFTVAGMEVDKAFFIIKDEKTSPLKKGLASISGAMTLASAALSTVAFSSVSVGVLPAFVVSMIPAIALSGGNFLVSRWRDAVE